MKVFETNAGLGYQQIAYLIRLNKSKNGYDYLCIDTNNVRGSETYESGKVIKDLEDFYVEESSFRTIDSSLYGTFLYDHFIFNANNEK